MQLEPPLFLSRSDKHTQLRRLPPFFHMIFFSFSRGQTTHFTSCTTPRRAAIRGWPPGRTRFENRMLCCFLHFLQFNSHANHDRKSQEAICMTKEEEEVSIGGSLERREEREKGKSALELSLLPPTTTQFPWARRDLRIIHLPKLSRPLNAGLWLDR